MAEQSAGGAEFQVLNYGAIRSTERSVASTGARCRARSNPQETQSAKCGAPSQIGGLHGADKVERGAICVKQRMPSVEHGAIHDRCDRKVRGPATRDVFGRKATSRTQQWVRLVVYVTIFAIFAAKQVDNSDNLFWRVRTYSLA